MEKNSLLWNLYVLRYNYSGNYYVGTTPNFENRMLIHWRRTSSKKNLPKWSRCNKSTKGFKYYWFNINSIGVSQSVAARTENAFTKELRKTIENFSDSKQKTKIYICGGDSAKPPDTNIDLCEKDNLVDDEIHKKINMYLKNIKECKLKENKLKENNSFISLLEVGNVGEYKETDHSNDWYEVASVEFSNNNKDGVH